MDEPLGALDKKLREQMQIEIKQLHERLGVTVVYVTHDQSEALTMSDRIAVFHDGRVVQQGTPDLLYNDPAMRSSRASSARTTCWPVPSMRSPMDVCASRSMPASRYSDRSGRTARPRAQSSSQFDRKAFGSLPVQMARTIPVAPR